MRYAAHPYMRYVSIAAIVLVALGLSRWNKKRKLNMLPIASFDNKAYGFRSYAINARDGRIGRSLAGLRSYFKNLPCDKLGHVISFSSKFSSLSGRIGLIFCVCTKKEMFRVYAWRVVACMAKAFSFGYWSAMDKPTGMSSPNIFTLMRVPADDSVQVLIFGALPNPAAIRFKCMFPEALLEGLLFARPTTKPLWSLLNRLPKGEEFAPAS